MQNDYITLKALSCELNDLLQNSNINKVYQPENDEICLTLRKTSLKLNLIISTNPSSPSIYTSLEKKENPQNIKSFCMHLRKLFSNAAVDSVKLLNFDRIFRIDITNKNELRDLVHYSLVFEHMGRYSNLFILDANDKILNSLLPLQGNILNEKNRFLALGSKYAPIVSSKINIEDVESILTFLTADVTANSFFANVSGVSKQLAQEIIFMFNKYDFDKEKLRKYLNDILNIYNTNLYDPHILIDKNMKAKDFFIYPYNYLKNNQFKKVSSISEGISLVKANESKRISSSGIAQVYRKKIDSLINKVEKRIKKNEETLIKCKKMDEYKKFGDNILNNIYLIKKKDQVLNCVDYVTGENISIKIDGDLSPQQNAKKYFSEYDKLKKTKEYIENIQQKLIDDLNYYKILKEDMEISKSKDDFVDIKEILISLNVIKNAEGLKKKNKSRAPNYSSVEINGFTVLYGKNSLQNDFITFSLANGDDLWVHVKDEVSSHAIIRNHKDIDIDTIKKVASLVSYNSRLKNEESVVCDYTFKKYVKRHPSKKMGLVTYKNYSTIVAKPENIQ